MIISREQLEKLCGSGWAFAHICELAGHASDRRFARVTLSGRSKIVVDSSRERHKIAAYISVSESLRTNGFSAPEVFAVDSDSGYLVVEDFGETTLGQATSEAGHARRMACASVLDILPELHAIPRVPLLPDYSVDVLLAELAIFTRWFCIESGILDSSACAAFLDEWRSVLAATSTIDLGRGFVHKDLHLDNLMWLGDRAPRRRVGFLDFQDAKYGSAVYDVVSLLDDPRYPLDAMHRRELLARFARVCATDVRDVLDELYTVYSVQRSLKILGNIHYLAIRRRKKGFQRLIPPVLATIRRGIDLPTLRQIKPHLEAAGLLD